MFPQEMQPEKITVEKVFGELYHRLFVLRDYRFKDYDDPFDYEDAMADPRQSLNYEDLPDLEILAQKVFQLSPRNALIGIDDALNEITKLEQKGVQIADNISTYSLDYNTGGQTKDERPRPHAKTRIYERVQAELAAYKTQLTALRERQEKLRDAFEHPYSTHEIKTIEISKDYKLPNLIRDAKPPRLDKYQTALFFEYLRKKDVIQNYSDASLSKLVSLLTGHSAENLRQQGFGALLDIKRDKQKNKVLARGKHYNLNSIKKVLEEIINDINSEMSAKN